MEHLRAIDIEKLDDDFIMSISMFLENFKHVSDKEEIKELLKDEISGNKFTFEENAIIAAVVEKLSNENGVKPPKWVNNAKYFLKNPIYSWNTKNKDFQELLRAEAPVEFSKRNIYYGKNALDRI